MVSLSSCRIWFSRAVHWLARPLALSTSEQTHSSPGSSPVQAALEDAGRIFDATPDGVMVCRAADGLVVQANHAAATLHGYTLEAFIGLPPTSFMHAESPTCFRDCVQAAGEGEFQARALHLRRDGSSFDVEVRGIVFTYQGHPCLLSVIRDVSDQVRAERRLQMQMEARLREQATILAFSQTLAATLEFRPGVILDQMQALIEYTHGAIFALDHQSLLALALRGPHWQEGARPVRLYLDEAEPMTWLGAGHTSHSPDSEGQDLPSLLRDQVPGMWADIQRWMWLPLAAQGQVLGGILIAHTDTGHFTPHQIDLARTIANQVAITILNAHLHQQAQMLAVLEERQRLAHTLHDAINQSLFSAGLIAEVLPRLWEQDPQEARHSLEDLRRLTIGAAAEMRGLLAELRPLVLIDADLPDLLHQLGNALTGRTNIPVRVTVRGQAARSAGADVFISKSETTDRIVERLLAASHSCPS